VTFNKVNFVSLSLIATAVIFISGCTEGQPEQHQNSHTHDDGSVHVTEHTAEPVSNTETNHDHDHDNDGAHIEPTSDPIVEHDDHGQVVHLDANSSANLNLVTMPIKLETWFDRIKIPGTVSIDPDRMVHVSLPATVRILQLNAPLHSTVSAGQQLAVLELVDPQLNQMQIRRGIAC